MNTPILTLDHQNPPEDDIAILQLAQQFPPHHNPTAVEVGVWTGNTTLRLAKLGFTVYAVDHWLGSPNDPTGHNATIHGQNKLFNTFCQNMGPYLFTKVFPLFGPSHLWAKAWPKHLPIQLLFIDANHDYLPCLQDIQLWSPHVSGVIAGHDFNPIFPGTQRAVMETGPYQLKGYSVWWRTPNTPLTGV